MNRTRPKPRRSGWFIGFVIGLFVGISVSFYGFWKMSRMAGDRDHPIRTQDYVPETATNEIKKPVEPISQSSGQENEIDAGLVLPPIGLVEIRNRWGMVISKIPAAVVEDAWVALPTKACLGGEQWTFLHGENDKIRVIGGIWRDGDPVGLWRFEKGNRLKSPALSSWIENDPLEFLPLQKDGELMPVRVVSSRRENPFVYCLFDRPIREQGLLIQNDRVVGWTFGERFGKRFGEKLNGGFLWNGQEGMALDYKVGVEYFYDLTFSNGREEQFSKALAMKKETSSMELLESLAEGFRLNPRLPLSETPPMFHPNLIAEKMHLLAVQLLKEEYFKEVADILNDQIIVAAADIRLLIDAIRATERVNGIESAIQMIEGPGLVIEQTIGRDFPGLRKLQARLYIGWVKELIMRENFNRGWRIYQRGTGLFPDNSEIHLLGAEIALAEGDWAEAKEILDAKEYSLSQSTMVKGLEARISELKNREEMIVIRFEPGAGQIPVTAVLEGSLRQNFYIDTGASMVTIPSSAVEALGIKITKGSPRRRISTAGGVRTAYEVSIGSIEVEGWVVRDIKALVLDIEDRQGFGLLGLDYLRRFNMELDEKEGLLTLRPR